MTVQVLLFAQAREYADRAQDVLELPSGSKIEHALDLLVQRYAALGALRPHLAVAMNGTLARPGDALVEGAELALLPPVSGG